jgi:D-galactarolactone cycloisomerase
MPRGTHIRRVRPRVLLALLPEHFADSQACYRMRGAMLVKIETGDGIVGWGEAFGPPALTAPIITSLAPLRAGADSLAGAMIRQRLCNTLRDQGQRGLPIQRLMGGPLRTTVRAYATGFYRRDRPDHDTYLRKEADARRAEGFGAVKLKTVLRVPEDIAGHLEVKARQPIAVAGGEASFTRWGFRDIIASRAANVLEPDVAACGRLSEAKTIAHMAIACGLRTNPHLWGTGIARAASLHLLAVIPDSPPGLFPIPPMLELDRSTHPVRDALTEPARLQGGSVAMPEAPGLGVPHDRAALARFCT